MRLSVPASFLLHAAMLLWAFLHIAHTPELLPPQQESIAISMITPSDLLRLKQGSENSTELEAKPKEEPKPEISKKEAEKPKPIDGPPPAAEPPPPQEEAKPAEPPPEAKPPEPKADPIADQIAALPPKPPEPAPGPTPEELKKIEDEKQAEEARKAEEQKKAEEEKKKAEEEKKKAEDEKRKAEEKKKADEKKRKEREKKLAEAKKKKEEEAKKKASEADRLAALLDKTPDKRGAPRSATDPQTDTDYTGPTAGAREGRDTVLSARESDILKGKIVEQLKGCWRLPGAGGGIETTVVTVSWTLRQDGSLEGEPMLEGAQSSALYQQAADAALRAVKNCSPFDLPADKYQFWRKLTFDFDPREMMGP